LSDFTRFNRREQLSGWLDSVIPPVATCTSIAHTRPLVAGQSLAFTLRHAVHRGNAAQAELDANQLRLAVEYPLDGRF
jgi:hypothetical protein